MNDNINRREVKARRHSWASATAGWLAEKGVTPNQISLASVFFAVLAAKFLLLARSSPEWWLWIGALLSVILRLLCNLFDGMVAVEGGKKTASGEIFNDLPDRISDPVILVATGYSIHLAGVEILGWLAGMGAVFTAYTRYLGAATGAGHNFCGPMAKQHRMAAVCAAYMLMAVFNSFDWAPWIIFIALCVIVAGTIETVRRRVSAAVRKLETHCDKS